MNILTKMRSAARLPALLLKNFGSERRGVAAIEFAMIAPLLLVMYFVTMEIAPAIDSSKKVGRGASMIADLITQQQSVKKADVEAIMRIGDATLLPYSRTKLKAYVTAIKVDTSSPPKALVVWSRKMIDGAFSVDKTPGTEVTIPTDLKVANSFYIKVETALDYRPMIVWTADQKKTLGLLSAFDNINMREAYFLRPRVTSEIGCSDC